jgi:hypothetical protein
MAGNRIGFLVGIDRLEGISLLKELSGLKVGI